MISHNDSYVCFKSKFMILFKLYNRSNAICVFLVIGDKINVFWLVHLEGYLKNFLWFNNGGKSVGLLDGNGNIFAIISRLNELSTQVGAKYARSILFFEMFNF